MRVATKKYLSLPFTFGLFLHQKAVFRIHDFRCGSGSADPCLALMDLDADPDPAIFVMDLQDANLKLILKKFYCLLLYFLKVLLHNLKKIKSPKEVTEQQESKVVLLFLLDDRRIRIREAQKHVDPVDPEHCKKINFFCV
jgi:hypothetical protein